MIAAYIKTPRKKAQGCQMTPGYSFSVSSESPLKLCLVENGGSLFETPV